MLTLMTRWIIKISRPCQAVTKQKYRNILVNKKTANFNTIKINGKI